MRKLLLATAYRPNVYRMMAHRPAWVWRLYLKGDPMMRKANGE